MVHVKTIADTIVQWHPEGSRTFADVKDLVELITTASSITDGTNAASAAIEHYDLDECAAHLLAAVVMLALWDKSKEA